jgi:hypothetical protein
MLREAVLKKMEHFEDHKNKIIYEKSTIYENISLEILVIVVKVCFGFSVYQGTFHPTGDIFVERLPIDNDMLISMINS